MKLRTFLKILPVALVAGCTNSKPWVKKKPPKGFYVDVDENGYFVRWSEHLLRISPYYRSKEEAISFAWWWHHQYETQKYHLGTNGWK